MSDLESQSWGLVVHKIGESGRGIGSCFPRFERVRDDERPDQTTSSVVIIFLICSMHKIAL